MYNVVESNVHHCCCSLKFVSEISPWTGRFYSLLDPSYAKNNIPIIASVSEHQPTTWSSFYFDLQMLVFMFPGIHVLLGNQFPETICQQIVITCKSSGTLTRNVS